LLGREALLLLTALSGLLIRLLGLLTRLLLAATLLATTLVALLVLLAALILIILGHSYLQFFCEVLLEYHYSTNSP
jgi:cytochrome b subunit of formate dehydrogenase